MKDPVDVAAIALLAAIEHLVTLIDQDESNPACQEAWELTENANQRLHEMGADYSDVFMRFEMMNYPEVTGMKILSLIRAFHVVHQANNR